MFPRNFAREWFLGGENLTSSSTKTAKTINFKFCAHIFNWVLHNSVPAFFLILRYLFFMVLGKFPPIKFPPRKSPPPPRKFPPRIFLEVMSCKPTRQQLRVSYFEPMDQQVIKLTVCEAAN